MFLSEAMAVKEAVLSQSPEFKDARIRAFRNATAIYDLLTVILTKWSQFALLKEVSENIYTFKCKLHALIIIQLLLLYKTFLELLSG